NKKLMQSRTEIDNLQQQVNEQQTLLARQTREVTLLKTDVSYLETIARDRLDLMKEGETIFRLETAHAKPKLVAPARKYAQRRSPLLAPALQPGGSRSPSSMASSSKAYFWSWRHSR